MNTLSRHLFLCQAAVMLAFLLWLPCRPAAAATIAQVTAALDNPVGVTITKMEYWKYKLVKENDDGQIYYWFVKDNNGDYIYTVSDGAKKWAVLSKTADTTTPAWGGSCIYSTGVDDGEAARIYLKVRGPGKLSYLLKTSCDDSDSFNAYVDNINMDDEWQSESGYGEDYTWEEMELEIDGGLAESGAFAGTPFHEIVFEFFKSEPFYDGKTEIKDGPQKADNPDYSEEIKYFKDRIWLDRVVWTPEPVDIALDPNPNPINEEEPPAEAALRGVFINTLTVNIISNAEEDFGYHIRYTTDGTTPTANSPIYNAETGVLLTGTCTLKAKVFDALATGKPSAVVP
ncbi:MAG TPA: chitobiase/beta-hexosaminidase C-terminal domain-containing protein, partial [Lentisphaeria bacterium]|nr:chitobiase/beta-hexosaminidase C-terminal domain-containing protein [Lentisphaeria bacterium]